MTAEIGCQQALFLTILTEMGIQQEKNSMCLLKRAFSKAYEHMTTEIRYQQAFFRNLIETGIQQVISQLFD